MLQARSAGFVIVGSLKVNTPSLVAPRSVTPVPAELITLKVLNETLPAQLLSRIPVPPVSMIPVAAEEKVAALPAAVFSTRMIRPALFVIVPV